MKPSSFGPKLMQSESEGGPEQHYRESAKLPSTELHVKGQDLKRAGEATQSEGDLSDPGQGASSFAACLLETLLKRELSRRKETAEGRSSAT